MMLKVEGGGSGDGLHGAAFNAFLVYCILFARAFRSKDNTDKTYFNYLHKFKRVIV